MRLVFGSDRAVAEWVARRIDIVEDGFGPCSAIGIADGNRPIAGAVFSNWSPKFKTLQVSIAAIDPRWAQRGIIRGLLHYVFEQQDTNKLWSIMRSSNERAIRFNLGLGFTREGILSHQFDEDHAVVTRMFRRDYVKRYGRIENGQEGRRLGSGSA